MSTFGNMGPFAPTSLKGKAQIHGVPVFVDKLPLTLGGIAGEDLPFGRVVSINPADNRRVFYLGKPTNNHIIKGVVMLDPTIMRVDPAMNDFYFAGRPVTVTTFGILDINEYDISQGAPAEGSSVWVNNATGELAFNDGTSLGSGYTALNASVYETLDPNGAKVFFGTPFVSAQTRETIGNAVTPVATPAAGEVAEGTKVVLTTTTAGAIIYYTTDGEDPTTASDIYTGPIVVSAAVTVKAIAVAADGSLDPSTALSAAYTIEE